MKRATVGSVLLIEHSGKPTEWTVQKTGDDDMAHLLEIFETAKVMCNYEILMGGRLKLFSSCGDLIKEYSRGASHGVQ